MLEHPFLRRSVTVSVVVVAFVLATALAPLVVAVALATDLFRWIRNRTPWMATRMFAFLWVYLLGEVWAVVALGTVALLPERASMAATYRLQEWWTAWNLSALRALFRMRFAAEGLESITPGPILVFSRHTSLIDSLLPAHFVTRPHRLSLRYVLKRELLIDPALDIAGNRLPNCFVRRAGTADHEQGALRELAEDLGEREGILIYPEGTRYSDEKREAFIRRLGTRPGRIADIAAGLRHVLPPRPGGTLTLLDATRADVVVLAHRGLEGLARFGEVWQGGLVGTRVTARFWRIPHSEIPADRAARVEWLFGVWEQIDSWVGEQELLLADGR